MKSVKGSVTLLLTALIFNACTKVVGDGPTVTETRTVSNFSELGLSISGDVIFKQDNDYKLEIRAQENILDIIETTVIGNELQIKFKNDVRVRTHDPILVTLSAPNVSSFRLSGSGNLRTTGPIQSDHLKLKISGSGSIFIPSITSSKLETEISGSGDIAVTGGVATEEHLRVSGSGSIDLLQVVSKIAETTTSGSGTMRVNVSEKLDASISGSGNVHYKGNPVVTAHISGSGKVKPI